MQNDAVLVGERDKSIASLSALQIRDMVVRRKISSREVVESLIRRVDSLDRELHAFCDFDKIQIRAAADGADQAIRDNKVLGPLHGVPIAVKDLIVTKGMRTTRGSNLFRNDVPTFDAPVIGKLRAAGGIVFGKTNTSELGWKSAGSNRVFQETRNPWNLDRTPGGSSAGSAVALAAGMVPLALGTDGGGSCRMPASFCGTFGYKPSLGRWALFPPAPVGPMSHVGPMSRTVDDAAMLYRSLCGPDDRDIFSLPADDSFEEPVRPAERLRIGWSADLGFMPIDAEVRQICERAVRKFEAAGCEIVPLDIKVTDPSRALEIIFATGIGSAVRSFENWREDLDPGLAKLIASAETLSPFEVAGAGLLRAALSTQLAQAMANVDVLVTPTVPIKPFPVGQDGPDDVAGNDLGPVRWFAMTAIFNMTGQPVASVPCGFDSDGLPVGLQIVGPRYADLAVFSAAKTYEQVAPWAGNWPPISGLG